MTQKRTMRRAPPDRVECRCGLRRAFVVDLTCMRKNRFGLMEEQTRILSFCSQHGRRYAAKFGLDVPAPVKALLKDRGHTYT